MHNRSLYCLYVLALVCFFLFFFFGFGAIQTQCGNISNYRNESKPDTAKIFENAVFTMFLGSGCFLGGDHIYIYICIYRGFPN